MIKQYYCGLALSSINIGDYRTIYAYRSTEKSRCVLFGRAGGTINAEKMCANVVSIYCLKGFGYGMKKDVVQGADSTMLVRADRIQPPWNRGGDKYESR